MVVTFTRYSIYGIRDKPNNKLSKLDKAFIMLNYPPDLTDYGDEASRLRLTRFNKAMSDLRLTRTASAKILGAFQSLGSNIELSERLEAMRRCYIEESRKSLRHQCKCVR